MGKRCEECQFWDFKFKSAGEKMGTCDHPMVEAKVTLDEEHDGETVIHTSSTFGCIYHTPLHGNVVTKLPEL